MHNPTTQPQPPDDNEKELLRKLFDDSFYLDQNRDVFEAKLDPYAHFTECGAREGRNPHPLFDTAFYLLHHPEAANSGLNPVLHFLRVGAREGANPHPLFDTRYYLHKYPDVASSGVNPLLHFLEHGAAEKRNPHPFFDTAAYLVGHPATYGSGTNPLVHFVRAPYHPFAGSDRTELLRRELAIERMQTEQLTRELKALHAIRQTPARNRSTQLPGELLRCLSAIYMNRVFYCHDGRRHCVRSEDHLRAYGLSPNDIRIVDDAELRQYSLAAALPLPWPDTAWDQPVRVLPHDLREISTLHLRGSGIEFGAGSTPMSVPLHCDVTYADYFREEDLKSRGYGALGSDFVAISHLESLEDMSGIPDGSLDFVIASHVIEHLRNPVRAMGQVFRKLRPGGSFVLVVPDKRLMFDRQRELTTLDHLLADYAEPSPDRDVAHYIDFYRHVYAIPEDKLAQRVKDAIAGDHDLHFHTWTYESFRDLVNHLQHTVSPWTATWSQPPIWEHPAGFEFYFVLTK